MIQKIQGKVIPGKQVGRTIGIHTANIKIGEGSRIEAGVYKINVVIEGKVWAGVGTHLQGTEIFESHIFDFEEDIYDKEIEVILLLKLRDNKKFESLEALKAQIQEDIQKAKEVNFTILTFGAFDLVHEGHRYYLEEARKYGNTLITIVARDANIEKIKGKKSLYDEQKRLRDVENMRVANKALLGDQENPMKWLDIYKPEVICLGYDQRGFAESLFDALVERNLETEIITLPAFQPEIYKSSLLKQE